MRHVRASGGATLIDLKSVSGGTILSQDMAMLISGTGRFQRIMWVGFLICIHLLAL